MKELPVHRGMQLGCPKCHCTIFRKHLDGHFSCVRTKRRDGMTIQTGCGYEWTVESIKTEKLVAKRAMAKADEKREKENKR